MTSAAYRTTPNLLPAPVYQNFGDGTGDSVAPIAVAALVLEGSGSPAGLITAPEGSLYTDTGSGLVYTKSGTGTSGWALAGGGTSPLTTKGDIFVHGASDTRLPVGANNQMLIANSAQATGLQWVAQPDLTVYETIAAAAAAYLPIVSSYQRGFGALPDNGSTNLSQGPLINYLAQATPGTQFTTFTVNLNAGAADGSHSKFVMPGGCAAITVQGGGGSPAAVKGGLTAAVAGVVYDYVFDANLGANGTWYLAN